MIETKCTCDYCGGEVRIMKKLIDHWSHTTIHLNVTSRPTMGGPEAGGDISINSRYNICLACAKTILEGVERVIESVRKV